MIYLYEGNSIKFRLWQLLFMKRGGELIYAGSLGRKSCELVKYFEVGIIHISYRKLIISAAS